MYRRPKFLEELLEIREQMSRDAYYDADLFAEHVRSGKCVTVMLTPKKAANDTAKKQKIHKGTKRS
jgi:hypothetical protein